MNVSYKNHKKHKKYPNGRSEKETMKEFHFSLNPTAFSEAIKHLFEFLKTHFPF